MGLISAALVLVLAADPCAEGLAKGRAKLERSPKNRIRRALELVASACKGPLGDAAAKAAKLERSKRAVALAAAATCKVPEPAAAAESIAAECPDSELQGPVLRDLDAGTYAFIVALRLQVKGTADAELVLSQLALAAALEGEKARKP